MARRVLVVDDDPGIRDALRMILEYEGYQVATASEGKTALAALDADRTDAVLLDIKMPGNGRARDPRPHRRTGRRPSGAHDLGARRHRDGGRGDAPRGRGLSREAAGARADPDLAPERPLPQFARRRERAPPPQARRGVDPRRQERPDAAPPRGGRARGAHDRHGPDLGRERDGQGARGAGDPQGLEGRRRPLHPGQLRRDPRGADRIGALRTREGLLHGRRAPADREVRRGRRRHDLPGRGRRHVRPGAGEGAARARGGRSGAGRSGARAARQRAGARRHQPGPRRIDPGGALPRRPLLPL